MNSGLESSFDKSLEVDMPLIPAAALLVEATVGSGGDSAAISGLLRIDSLLFRVCMYIKQNKQNMRSRYINPCYINKSSEER